MRTLALAALTMVTAFGASAADAQRLGHAGGPANAGASYPVPGAAPSMPQGQPQMQRPPMMQPGQPMQQQPGQPPRGGGPRGQQFARGPQRGNQQRWGGSVGGHWQGGMNAPGGWNAYHRPSRGYRLPSYWISPSFFIDDYAGYGLSAPPQGYGWRRYYDDAVLTDSRGRVYDSVDGIDWDGGYDGYGDGGYGQGGGYPPQGPGYGQPYPQPYPVPPVVQNGNVTTYSTSSGYAAGGYAAGGYYYPGATTTVVTIQAAPSVTTTTTEYVETTRTRYVAAPRRVYHAPKKRYYRPRRKCACQVEQPVLGS